MVEEFSPDFYSTAAEVMVVLFVLVGIEFRVLRTLHEDEDEIAEADVATAKSRAEGELLELLVALGLVATVVIGIGGALQALHSQSASDAQDRLIVGALGVEVIAVVAFPAMTPLSRLTDLQLARYEAATNDLEAAALKAMEAQHERDLKPAIRAQRRATLHMWANRIGWLSLTSALFWVVTAAFFVVPAYALALLLGI